VNIVANAVIFAIIIAEDKSPSLTGSPLSPGLLLIVQALFTASGLLMVLSGVGYVGSMIIEQLAGKHMVSISNGELTVTGSVIDRILLAIFAITALVTLGAWAEIRRRR
jgi:hypothetical protein